jgi:hypothetical protein
MSNFIFAIVATVYALACLTKEAEQEKCSTSKSAEECFKKGAEEYLSNKITKNE